MTLQLPTSIAEMQDMFVGGIRLEFTGKYQPKTNTFSSCQERRSESTFHSRVVVVVDIILTETILYSIEKTKGWPYFFLPVRANCAVDNFHLSDLPYTGGNILR